MKKTTQELLKFAFERMNYQERNLKFWDYEIIYFYGGSEIKKEGRKIWVVVDGEFYINSFFERFLFWRQVEKNLSNITDFFKKYLERMWEEEKTLNDQLDNLKNKVSDLEDKLAQSVASTIDLSANTENDD